MKYLSTRGGASASLDEALTAGIAEDGGLFLPEFLPSFTLDDLKEASSMHELAHVVLAPFFDGSALEEHLERIILETFAFPVPLVRLSAASGNLHVLELFHGPTAAFKDFGASFLAACLSRLQTVEAKPLTILVATSGDTGGAVAAAFNERPGMQVVVLFPEGRVSERQQRQLTCWGENVLSLAVKGSFDDCQALVKQAMADPELSRKFRFSSANSINIGRLLPQSIYYAHASLSRYRVNGSKSSFIVPSGNLGNGLALLLAKQMGLPVDEVVFATNANRVVANYLDTGDWEPGASVRTLASAMDVGNPSNMERIRSVFGDASELRRIIRTIPVSDNQIEQEIRRHSSEYGGAICPHTATACYAYRQLDEDEQRMKNWIVVATAHPAKFEQIVEPLTGQQLALPKSLEDILVRPARSLSIEPALAAFDSAVENAFLAGKSTVTGSGTR